MAGPDANNRRTTGKAVSADRRSAVAMLSCRAACPLRTCWDFAWPVDLQPVGRPASRAGELIKLIQPGILPVLLPAVLRDWRGFLWEDALCLSVSQSSLTSRMCI